MATIKRIFKEYQQYQKEALDGIILETSEDNLIQCTCYFKVQCPNNKIAWIPMLTIFPSDYPLKPPEVGFPIDFGYTTGASYIKRDGPLNGMLVICLDILGNFAHVHDEWAGTKGSGWSPSYTLTTLLVNMQTVICDEISIKSPFELDKIYTQWINYSTLNNIVINDSKSNKKLSSLNLEPELNAAIELIQSKLQGELNTELSLIIAKLEEISIKPAQQVESEIFCWFSNLNYTEDILGYGIQLKPQGRMIFLGTDGNYIGFKSFTESKLRQYPNKDTFQHLLPAWINPSHSSSSQWTTQLNKSLQDIGRDLKIINLEDIICRVLPDLINTMVVKIMDTRSDIRASNVVFKCLLNLWRILCYLVSTNSKLKQKIKKITNDFITDKKTRLKSSTPNVGNMLAMSLCLGEQDLNWSNFLQAFEEECNLRRVMWWKKECRGQLNEINTFAQCKISRNNVLFQTLLRSVIHEKGINNTLEELDAHNCNLEGGVEKLLDSWRQIEQRINGSPNWIQYFTELKTLGFPQKEFDRIVLNVNTHIQSYIKQAASLQGY
jgi:ubiquitin-protein ligase